MDSFQKIWPLLGSVAALIISGLISWWLAAKIARPIQSLALASGLQGEGDFSTAIDERIRQRPDEIGALAQQLHTSGIKIQNLLKKQKDFLRDVSHEVRTPLARLQVAAETLELDARDERALNQIKHQVLVIDQLVQNLLHLSHFDRPSQSHNIESIPLRNLVYRCVENAQMVAEPQKHLSDNPRYRLARSKRHRGSVFTGSSAGQSNGQCDSSLSRAWRDNC